MKKQSKSLLGLLIGVIVLIGCMLAGPCMAKNNSTQINIEIGKKTFKATLYNNKTSSALLKKFPLSCKMSELNGNEKYKYLSYELPTNKKKVKRIQAGDIMLYGSDCLVVFYRSHKTSYKYTKVGHINNTSGLKKAVGKGKVKMKFTRIREQSNPNTTPKSDSTEMPKPSPDVTVQPTVMPDDTAPNQQANKKLMIKIGDKKVDVSWEENESVGALMDMCKDSPLEIQMSMYGGFEQVGHSEQIFREMIRRQLPHQEISSSIQEIRSWYFTAVIHGAIHDWDILRIRIMREWQSFLVKGM